MATQRIVAAAVTAPAVGVLLVLGITSGARASEMERLAEQAEILAEAADLWRSHRIERLDFELGDEAPKQMFKVWLDRENLLPGYMTVLGDWEGAEEIRLEIGHLNGSIMSGETIFTLRKKRLPARQKLFIEPLFTRLNRATWTATEDWYVSIGKEVESAPTTGSVFLLYPTVSPCEVDDVKHMQSIVKLYGWELAAKADAEGFAAGTLHSRSDPAEPPVRLGKGATVADYPAALSLMEAPRPTGLVQAGVDVIPLSLLLPSPPAEGKDSDGKVDSDLIPVTLSDVTAMPDLYREYLERSAEHRLRVFRWQLLSSKIVFVVVLILMASGLVFAWIQFSRAMGRRGDAAALTTEIEATKTGLKVSSPVLGVIILTLSLAFFFLYLEFVYPIEIVPLE